MWSIGNANVLEIAWTLLAVVGLVRYAFSNWRRAIRKRQELRDNKINGINDRLARKEIRLQRYIAIALFGLVFLGVVLMLTPSSNCGSTGAISPAGIVLGVMLIVAAPTLTFWSSAERRDSEVAEREVEQYLSKQREAALAALGAKEE